MSVRALDANGDWIYGIGRSAYLTGRAEVAQDISTRLKSFLGDCFFDLGAGIDWLQYLGGKDQIGLNLAISAIILNTDNVTSINELSVVLDNSTRVFSVSYTVNTIFGVVQAAVPLPASNLDILTEDGFSLITEDGTPIVTG